MKRVALALLIALVAGCGGGTNIAGTHLRFTAFNQTVGLAVFHLDCAPAGGDVADPASACAALSRSPELVTSPKPFTCLGGPSSWFDMTITGQLAGKEVRDTFSTCWTPQMATLDKLGLARTLDRHVRHRRSGVVAKYTSRTFPPGALRPGDLITCRVGGHDLQIGVPEGGPFSSTGYGGVGVVGATLTAARHADGSITASCRRESS